MLVAENLKRLVTASVLTQLAADGFRYVPLAVSARHIHLTAEHVAILFGRGHALTPRSKLSQPNQFAARETLTFQGARGEIQNIRVLGPTRAETQLELSVTDCFKAGVAPMVRMSGALDGTPGGVIIGPAGRVEMEHGVVVARRHLHMNPSQARAYGLEDQQVVSVKIDGPRPGRMEDVTVRVGDGHWLDLHIDTDEANAFLVKTGDLAALETEGAAASPVESPALPPPVHSPKWDLVTEEVVRQAAQKNEKQIVCAKGGLVTPAAWDAAKSLQIEIVKE